MQAEGNGEADAAKAAGTTIHKLLRENLAHIFQYLDLADSGRVARVCRQWRDVVNHPSLWRERKLVIGASNRQPHHHMVSSLAERRIDSIRMLRISDSLLRDVLAGVTTLTTLDLIHCDNLTDDCLMPGFMMALPGLQTLLLGPCTHLTDATVALIAVNCRNLINLNLYDCPLLTDLSMLLIARGLPKLSSLSLIAGDVMTDAGIGHLVGRERGDLIHLPLPRLRQLQLSDCPLLTDHALLRLTNGQQSLEQLTLERNDGMTDAGLAHLTRMPALTSVFHNLSGVTDRGLSFVAAGRVVNLVLGSVMSLTEEAFDTIATMTHLQHLVCVSAPYLTNGALLRLASGKSAVHLLDLHMCHQFGQEGLRCISALEHLRALKLTYCNNVGDRGLDQLASGGSKLVKLTVKGCNGVSHAALRLVASGLFHLEWLKMDEGRFDTQGIELAIRSLHNLVSVRFANLELGALIRTQRHLMYGSHFNCKPLL